LNKILFNSKGTLNVITLLISLILNDASTKKLFNKYDF